MCGIISIFQKHFWKYEQVKAYIDRMQDMNECMIGKVKTSVDKREVFIQIYISNEKALKEKVRET